MKPNALARAAAAVAILLAIVAGLVGPAGAEEPPPAPDPRIVGGTVAPAGAWPSQVALISKGSSPSQGQFCGGTVVDRSWILTAGHCISTDSGGVVRPDQLDVLVGTQHLASGGTRIAVAEVRRHPGWRDDLRNDIALLRLDTPVPSGTPIQTLASSDPAAGTDVVTTGWGRMGNGAYPNQLMEVTLDFRSASTCRADNGPAFDPASMVCAWRSGKGGCYGDSGGPLVEDRDGTWTQVGVVSWGFDCGIYPSVYARVATFSSWIRWQVRYGPQPSANAFVRRQYLDLFGRQPTATELFYGAAALEDGQSTAAFVAGLLDGAAYRGRSGGVVRLYQAIFERLPETGGMTFWMGEINRGVPLKRIAELMVRAPEFTALYGEADDAELVALVYDHVLGRTPTEDEAGYWVSELASGRRTRGQVMVGFSESAEYRDLTATDSRTWGTAWALVRRVPNTGERSAWSALATVDLARHLLSSWSYANRF